MSEGVSKPFRLSSRRARERASEALPARVEDGPSQLRALRRTVVSYTTAEEYAQEIATLWQEAAESFLTIGRWLNRAKASLAHGEWQRLVDNQLPFDRNRAYQLRAVATLVDTGRVLESELPSSSATAYEFVSLDQEALERAKREGVLRPDVKRPEVKAWKRRVLGPSSSPLEVEVRRAELRARIARLSADIVRAQEELASLEAIDQGRTSDTVAANASAAGLPRR